MNLFFARPEAAPVRNVASPSRFNAAPSAPAAPPVRLNADSLTMAAAPARVKVADQDSLTLTAKAGDTYWGLARRFAATTRPDGVPSPTEINAYVKDLQAANGKSSTIRVGQALVLPMTDHATWKLPAMVAAQKHLGKKAAEFDWSQADAQWGYAESIEVTVPALKGDRRQGFAIREYGPTSGGSLYEIAPLKAPEAPREVTLTSQQPLRITAKAGDTYWGLARRFAATTRPDGVPSSSEINAYVKDLQAVNGKYLKAGQTVTIPRTERATWKLEALVAAQQDVETRTKGGEKLPTFDWARAEVKWGYAEAMEVTVSPLSGGMPERLAVHATGRDRYQVQSLAAYYAQNGLAE